MNVSMLLSKMALFGDTQKSLANELNISEQTFSVKKKTGSFTQPEIKAISERYKLTDCEIVDIFFAKQSS